MLVKWSVLCFHSINYEYLRFCYIKTGTNQPESHWTYFYSFDHLIKFVILYVSRELTSTRHIFHNLLWIYIVKSSCYFNCKSFIVVFVCYNTALYEMFIVSYKRYQENYKLYYDKNLQKRFSKNVSVIWGMFKEFIFRPPFQTWLWK